MKRHLQPPPDATQTPTQTDVGTAVKNWSQHIAGETLSQDQPRATAATITARFVQPLLGVIAVTLALQSSAGLPAAAADSPRDAKDIRPLLQQFCFHCHGAKKHEANLRLDTLKPNLSRGPDAETWQDVLNKLNLGEMPPKQARQPTAAQHRRLVTWITTRIQQAQRQARSNGGRVIMRRLTRYEYDITMRDLLGVDWNFAENLPPEPTSSDGFQNNGGSLGISPLQIEYYLQAARLGLNKAIVRGPKPPTIKHHAEKSEKIRRVKGEVSNRLAPDGRFLVRLERFPRGGEVRVRVRASSVIPAEAGLPRMRVTMGVRADVRAPEKVLGEVDVNSADPQDFEFRSRIEQFPLPGHNPKYPGLQITIYNIYDDGQPAKRPKKKRKNQKPPPPNPSDPLIVIQSVDFEGPIYDSWPPRSHTRIFPERRSEENEQAYARRILEHFMRRAYRRPVAAHDLTGMLTLFHQLRPSADSFESAMQETLAMVLVSPQFLYLVEPHADSQKPRALNGFELASRLSYFLWSTMPDQQLFDLAAADKLTDTAVLAAEVRRMIADPKSDRFVKHFTDQWFGLAGLDRVAVNPEFHPKFDERLKQDMRSETLHVFREILRNNLSCLNLIQSDFTMLNRRLARHYGITGPLGSGFEKVTLPADSPRGGLLTQGSFLLSNSNGEDSHPIKRAVWILDRLLDDPPAPPPPDVPDLSADRPDLAGLTLKQQLDIHRNKQACNNCHRRIDPWGIALERFDAVGQLRTRVSGRGKRKKPVPVDASVTLPNGATIHGAQELKTHLVTHHAPQFARNLVERLLTYSIGRSLDLADRKTVDKLTADFIHDDYRLSALIKAVVLSKPFMTK